MMKTILSVLFLFGVGAACGAVEFERPKRWLADGKPVRVESPGYAAPCLADLDKDGKKDLLVGQFSKGKIKFYKNLDNDKYAAGAWVQAEGDVAEVPGVW